MELMKNIFFNTDKLLKNSRVKISYTGQFFENNSKEVYFHYGFGENWENLTDTLMNKTELGFQIEIDLLDYNTLNFCFRNESDNWDNNNLVDYIFELESPPVDLIVIENTALDKPSRLRKAYLWSKKIRLAIYKIITFLPKLVSGNYKKKEESNL